MQNVSIDKWLCIRTAIQPTILYFLAVAGCPPGCWDFAMFLDFLRGNGHFWVRRGGEWWTKHRPLTRKSNMLGFRIIIPFHSVFDSLDLLGWMTSSLYPNVTMRVKLRLHVKELSKYTISTKVWYYINSIVISLKEKAYDKYIL